LIIIGEYKLKSNLFWIIIFSFLLIASVTALLIISQIPADYVRIYKDGELTESVNLSAVKEIYTIPLVEVYDEQGLMRSGINFIDIDSGRIRMGNADCPGKLCVYRGWVTGGIIPIVCLPNRVVIAFDNVQNPDIDALSG